MSKLKSHFLPMIRWYQKQKRALPWRDQPTVYRVWISEIMLQQTQVVTVTPYFEKFLNRFPDVKTLANASIEEVMKYWAGLGYYSRARNIHRSSQMIFENGRFPETREEWMELPGVGPYTAGAIVSIALNQPEPILDGNVERVLSRIHCEGDKEKLWNWSRTHVKHYYKKKVAPSVFNQALMELGALVCTPKKPDCENCPLRKSCLANERGVKTEFPPKKKRIKWVRKNEKVYCLIDDQNRVLIRRRGSGEWRQGLWDFPEFIPSFLKKAFFQQVGSLESKHIVTNHKIMRTTQVLKQKKRMLMASESDNQEMSWVRLSEISSFATGAAFKRTWNQIQKTFSLGLPDS